MAVLERTRNSASARARMSQARLLMLIFMESILLGTAGVIAGNVLGLAITGHFGGAGIDFGAFEAGLRVMPGLSNIVYPVARIDRSVMLSALVFAIACVTAIYPAAKAAGLEPVTAIRGLLGAAKPGARSRVAAARLPVFVLIAVRNLLRNRRRTAIMVATAAFGVLAYVFLLGFFDGFYEGMIDHSTRYITGHVQLERPDPARSRSRAFDREPGALSRGLRARRRRLRAPRVQAQATCEHGCQSRASCWLAWILPRRARSRSFTARSWKAGCSPRVPNARS